MNTVLFLFYFFGSYLIFNCHSKICERNTNKKSLKKPPKLHVHRCQILSEVLLLLVHFIGRKGFDKPPPSYLGQCLELDTWGVIMYLKMLIHLQMLERTRKDECEIVKTLEDPVVLVWLFQQEFWCQEIIKKLIYDFYPSINAALEELDVTWSSVRR